MTRIELEPDLSRCVQTLAREEHERIVRQLLASGEGDTELAERVEMLRLFLESTDFGSLRSQYEPLLLQGKRVKFTLRPGANATEYEMEVE